MAFKKFKDNNFNNLTGIDLRSEYINYGKERYNIDLQNTTIDKLSDTYDLIILSHLFEHIIDLDKFLSLCKDRLTTKGLLYIEVPSLIKTYYSPESPNVLYDFFQIYKMHILIILH